MNIHVAIEDCYALLDGKGEGFKKIYSFGISLVLLFLRFQIFSWQECDSYPFPHKFAKHSEL